MQIILFIFTSFLSKYELSSIFVTKKEPFSTEKSSIVFINITVCFFTANF